MSWGDLLDQWPLIETDLHELYGIDVGDDVLMASRSWRWLRARIAGLMSTDSRIARHFAPDNETGESWRSTSAPSSRH